MFKRAKIHTQKYKILRYKKYVLSVDMTFYGSSDKRRRKQNGKKASLLEDIAFE